MTRVTGKAAPHIVLKPGDMAPLFSLMGSDGHIHTLAEHRGTRPVVLAWFPKAFTPGCETECRSFGSSRPLMEGRDVAYFTASVDDHQQNRAFAAATASTYPILSDPTKDVATRYGVLSALGYAKRWTFYIGVDGRIQKIDKSVTPSSAGPDMAATLDALNATARPR